MEKKPSYVEHPIPPLYDKQSRILILGSFPSVKSREAMFFYGHKQNRFWKVLSSVLDCPLPVTVEEKKEMLLSHGIALWDVIASCEIYGSSDSSIRNVVPNDLSVILEQADIKQIYANGTKSFELYQKYVKEDAKRDMIKLPSTSPANASWTLDKLVGEWSQIKSFLMEDF